MNLRWRDHRLKSQEPTSSGKDDPGRTVGNILNSQRPFFSSFCNSFSWIESLALFSFPCSQSRAIMSVLVFCRIYCFRILCFLFQCSMHSLNHFLQLFPVSWLGIELSENGTFLTSGLTQTWCCSEFSLNVASAAEVAQQWEDELESVYYALLAAPSSSGRIVGKATWKDSTNVEEAPRKAWHLANVFLCKLTN